MRSKNSLGALTRKSVNFNHFHFNPQAAVSQPRSISTESQIRFTRDRDISSNSRAARETSWADRASCRANSSTNIGTSYHWLIISGSQ